MIIRTFSRKIRIKRIGRRIYGSKTLTELSMTNTWDTFRAAFMFVHIYECVHVTLYAAHLFIPFFAQPFSFISTVRKWYYTLCDVHICGSHENRCRECVRKVNHYLVINLK